MRLQNVLQKYCEMHRNTRNRIARSHLCCTKKRLHVESAEEKRMELCCNLRRQGSTIVLQRWSSSEVDVPNAGHRCGSSRFGGARREVCYQLFSSHDWDYIHHRTNWTCWKDGCVTHSSHDDKARAAVDQHLREVDRSFPRSSKFGLYTKKKTHTQAHFNIFTERKQELRLMIERNICAILIL